jgi:hypothetical protein
MVDDKKVVEPKPVEVKKPTAQDFADKYQKLCEELGYRIVVSPTWVSTNHGSFEMVLQYTIGELPKQ